MLPPEHRLRRSTEFSEVVRRGRRMSRTLVTVHLLGPDRSGPADPSAGDASTSRVGLVISKAVGNAVVRHRTARRLRHLLRERIASLPAGTRLVVRAAPRAARASSADLGADLDAALAARSRRSAPRQPHDRPRP